MNSLLEWYRNGGPVMNAILLVAVVGLAVFLERFYTIVIRSKINGRAFIEYGLIHFWGRGEGGYYATGDYSKGMTHRAEANANFQVGDNIYLNFDYVIRLEPRGDRVVQKMSAEARAVF